MSESIEVLFECGFQELDCDYRGENCVCEINCDPNAKCPGDE